MKLELYGQIFEKYSNINYHENSLSWRRILSCGWTDRLDETVAFLNFANAPKM